MAEDKSPESLDFTQPSTPPKRPPDAPARRTAPPSPPPEKTRGVRKLLVPALIVIAVVLAVVLGTREEPTQPPVERSIKPEAPAAVEAPPAPKPADIYPPPVQTAQPASDPASREAHLQRMRALPPEFMKLVQEYNTKAAHKAIALALDSDGKWAYGSISGGAAQGAVNEEALSECAKHKAKSAVQADCKLFAVGDKVVW